VRKIFDHFAPIVRTKEEGLRLVEFRQWLRFVVSRDDDTTADQLPAIISDIKTWEPITNRSAIIYMGDPIAGATMLYPCIKAGQFCVRRSLLFITKKEVTPHMLGIDKLEMRFAQHVNPRLKHLANACARVLTYLPSVLTVHPLLLMEIMKGFQHCKLVTTCGGTRKETPHGQPQSAPRSAGSIGAGGPNL
jgi:hypothetical protein